MGTDEQTEGQTDRAQRLMRLRPRKGRIIIDIF